MAEDKVNYAFVKGDPTVSPLLLLHGQGGDENDLLPIGKYLSPNSPMLSIRGRVQEQGMNRYFKHTENGGFDLNDLEQETTWLFSVLNDLCRKFDIDYERFIVIGYSNGANVAARALLTRSDTFHTGIFFHPMALSTVDSKQDLRTCLVSFKNYLQEGQYNHLKTAVKGTFTVFPKSPTFV